MITRIAFLVLFAILMQCKSQQGERTDDVALENTYWRLVEVNGNPVTTPPDGREVYMTLTIEEGQHRLKGHAGCNGLGGDYKTDGRAITFQPITTRMYCESQMGIENQFTQMLAVTDNYKIDRKMLTLFAGPAILGKFVANDMRQGQR